MYKHFYTYLFFSYVTRNECDMEGSQGGELSNLVSDGDMTRSNTLYSLGNLTDEGSLKGTSSPTDDGKLLMVQFTVDRLSLEVRIFFFFVFFFLQNFTAPIYIYESKHCTHLYI